ncbi:zinc ribbon domain-containing protein [Alienimonas chondri]|uniref:Zinc ribbon domain-containing protein n=1 Tax=Alienimonas chondri TaxID=2681879 RepID=A0ABX1VD57_9PLAN|nr:zinc ribbon domain-containing protein [Alienimonas chondri]NNJ25238.1 hypothetical protein [Alienimonas chondri]
MAWDDDSGEFEPYEDDAYGDDDAEELPCPSCGEPVYEETQRCPYCGDYITPGRSTALRNVPQWAVTLGVIGVVATIFALLGGMAIF